MIFAANLFSLEHLYFIISRYCIPIFTKIRQFHGLIYIYQLRNKKNEITIKKKKQYEANDDYLAINT